MPIKEAAFWVGLTLFGTGIYFIFERLDQPLKLIASVFIVVGFCGMAYSVFRHHFPTANLPSVTPWIWAPLVIIALGAIGYVYTHPTIPPSIARTPTEIYMACNRIALPIHIPPMTTAHVKTLNKKQYGNTKQALFDFRNDSPKDELLWPDRKLITSGEGGRFGYRCDVSNHAQMNLIDVAIGLTTNFDNEKEPLIYTAIVSPLDAGTVFSFYILNECPINVSVIAPDAVTVQVFGEDKRRTVPLHWPRRNPIEQIMVFFPSPVSWTGNVC